MIRLTPKQLDDIANMSAEKNRVQYALDRIKSGQYNDRWSLVRAESGIDRFEFGPHHARICLEALLVHYSACLGGYGIEVVEPEPDTTEAR